MTRRSRAFAAAGLIVCSFATPLGGRAVERACAASSVHIAVVVDSGSGSAVSAVCVPGGSRDNGATILATRAAILGTPQPRYNASGLLCAIDGLPASGCGEHTGSRYAYWSYSHGSGGNWLYSSIGPAAWRVDPGTVEGWRWHPDGTGLPSDPPPRGPAVASRVCVPPAPPTTARPRSPGANPAATSVVAPTIAPSAGANNSATAPRTGAAATPLSSGPSPSGRTSPANLRPGTATRGKTTTTASDASSTSTSIALSHTGLAALPGAPPVERPSSG